MKNLIQTRANSLMIAAMAFFFSALAWAQDQGGDVLPDVEVDITKETTTEEWYTNPLYWIIGALILVVLIAVLARGGRK